MAGTPSQQRRIEADNKRVENLRSIALAVRAWYDRSARDLSQKQLPPSLSSLVAHGVNGGQIIDPETKTAYEYRPLADSRYELCAVFSTSAEQSSPTANQFWDHGKGHTCFTLEASALRVF